MPSNDVAAAGLSRDDLFDALSLLSREPIYVAATRVQLARGWADLAEPTPAAVAALADCGITTVEIVEPVLMRG